MSDLHFEFHRDWGAKFLAELDPEGADVCVLAGDITTAAFATSLRHVFKTLAEKYDRIVYVPGNHEYYKTSPDVAARSIELAALGLPVVTFAAPGRVVIDGVGFYCGTMWFRDDPLNVAYEDQINDFRLIKKIKDPGEGSSLSPGPWVYEQQKSFENGLKHIRPGDVVVSHHLPSARSTPERFASSPINRFFVCDMEQMIAETKPSLWLHGHTHDPCDYKIGETRVVCNPCGYPGENAGSYRPRLIEIP